ISKRLVSFTQRLNLVQGQDFVWRPGDDDNEDVVSEEIAYVQALGVPTYDLGRWRIARAGWVARLTHATLQLCIDQKAQLLPSYQSKITENWLVIVADRTKLSGMFRFPIDCDPRRISSPFARTYLYLYPETPVIELAR